MSNKLEFCNFKKLLIFGGKGVGKSSLSKIFQSDTDYDKICEEVEPSTESKKYN